MRPSRSLLMLLASTVVATRGLDRGVRRDLQPERIGLHHRQEASPTSGTTTTTAPSVTPTTTTTPTPTTPTPTTPKPTPTSTTTPPTTPTPVEKTTTVTQIIKSTSVVGRVVTVSATTTITTDVAVTTTIYVTDTVTVDNAATATEVDFVTVTVTSYQKRDLFPRQTPVPLAKRALVTVSVVQTVVVTRDTTTTDFAVVRDTKTHVTTVTNHITKTAFQNAVATVTEQSTIYETFWVVNTGAETITNTATLPASILTSIQPTTETSTETAVLNGGSGGGGGSGSGSGGLSTGAKAGIGAGAGVVALLALAGIIVFVRQQRQKRSRSAPTWEPDGFHDHAEPTLPRMPEPGVGGALGAGYPPALPYIPRKPISPGKKPGYGVSNVSATPVVPEIDGRSGNGRDSVPMSEMSGETAVAGRRGRGSGVSASELENTGAPISAGGTPSPGPVSGFQRGAGGWTSGHRRGDSADEATELDSMMRHGQAQYGRSANEATELEVYSDVPRPLQVHGQGQGQGAYEYGGHAQQPRGQWGWRGGPIDERHEMP